MAISLGANLALHARQPLDDRTLMEDLATMKNYPESFLADICYCFNKEDGELYVFNRSNEIDELTGRWRKFKGGEGSSFNNKETLKKFGIDENGKLTFDGEILNKITYEEGKLLYEGNEINSSTNEVTYTDEEGAVKAIGGFEVGDKADKMSFQDFAYKLLHPYVAPVVSLSIAPSALQDKSGVGVVSVTLTANVLKKSKNIASVCFYCGTTLLENKTDDVSNGGTFTYTYTPETAIKSNTTFKVAISDGNIVNVSKTLSFAYPSYIGYVGADVTVDASNVQNLITDGILKPTTIQTGSSYTYTYTAINSRVVYLYDTSKTKITKILDSNGFGYISDFTSSTIELNGTDYYCLQQNIAATVSDFKFVFS